MNTIRVPKNKIKKKTCNILLLPKEICSISFNKDKYDHTIDKIYYSNRGDLVLLHLNKKGELIDIEICGKDQPCIK